MFNPVNHFSISKAQFEYCWPNCIVLISLIELTREDFEGSFSLMASNSIMEIPEKEKI